MCVDSFIIYLSSDIQQIYHASQKPAVHVTSTISYHCIYHEYDQVKDIQMDISKSMNAYEKNIKDKHREIIIGITLILTNCYPSKRYLMGT